MTDNLLNLTKGIALADLLLLLVSGVLAIIFFRRLDSWLKVFCIYLWVVGLVELAAKMYLYVWTDHDNLHLLHVYTLAEFLLLTLYFRDQFTGRRKLLSVWIVLGPAVLMTLSVLEYSGFGNYLQMYGKLLVNGSVLVYALSFFVRIVLYPEGYPRGWKGPVPLNSAILLYFSASLVVFLTLSYYSRLDVNESIGLWLVNVILATLLHLTALVTLWKQISRT